MMENGEYKIVSALVSLMCVFEWSYWKCYYRSQGTQPYVTYLMFPAGTALPRPRIIRCA